MAPYRSAMLACPPAAATFWTNTGYSCWAWKRHHTRLDPGLQGYYENDNKLLCVLLGAGLTCSATSSRILKNSLSQQATLHPLCPAAALHDHPGVPSLHLGEDSLFPTGLSAKSTQLTEPGVLRLGTSCRSNSLSCHFSFRMKLSSRE